MNVEYGMTVYFKTGRIWSSDPIPGSWEQADAAITSRILRFQEGQDATFQMIRNQRAVLVFRDAVDCIEFFVDKVDTNAPA